MKIKSWWQTWTFAPHRVLFLGGALQLLLTMMWWLGILLFPSSELLGAALPSNIKHGYLMVFGLFPWFMFGFLMTVFPRWMAVKELERKYYVVLFVAMFLGNGLLYLSGTSKLLAALGVMLVAAGWLWALIPLWKVLRETQHPDTRHAKFIFAALLCGNLALCLLSVAILQEQTQLMVMALQAGIWLFLLPVFVSVGHRMIPFFTSSQFMNAPPPKLYSCLYGILLAAIAHFVLSQVGLMAWLWLVDLPLAGCAIYLSATWDLRKSLSNPMLGVLHIGFAWIGLALTLFAIQSLILCLTDHLVWGLAPLHALLLGSFSMLMIGFATRVTQGHAGLPIYADKLLQILFVGIQLVALSRIVAELLPYDWRNFAYQIVCILWLICATLWIWRHLPVYCKPRIDGRAG